VAVVPISLGALVFYRRRLERRVRVMRERSADVGSFLIETLQATRIIVASNAQGRETARFRRLNDGFIDALLSMQRATYLSGGLPGVLLSLGTAAVFLYGGGRVIAGTLTLGTFAAFMAYQTRLMAPIQALMGLYAGIATARVSWARVAEILDAPPEVVETPDAVAVPQVTGDIRLQDVTFSYDRGTAVLEGANLHVAAGDTVAIVGASGSGKSTIADLLLRLIDPDSGAVLLDGRDIRTMRLADLRRHVVLLEQSPFVFHATIAENIRYARPDATDDDVRAAAAAAGLDEAVRGWHAGYETVVGERGLALSAGERQRVAIARALLANPAVLVLDEPTSALDPETERVVAEGFETFMRGRTTIVITHRRELASRAERVVVLDGARLAEPTRIFV
jgi:ATP-binding cassette subfamily B protein